MMEQGPVLISSDSVSSSFHNISYASCTTQTFPISLLKLNSFFNKISNDQDWYMGHAACTGN